MVTVLFVFTWEYYERSRYIITGLQYEPGNYDAFRRFHCNYNGCRPTPVRKYTPSTQLFFLWLASQHRALWFSNWHNRKFSEKKKTKLHISPTMLNSRKHPIIGLFFLNNIQSKWHQEREREAARFRIGADFQFKLSGWLLIADRWSHCPIMRSLARALQTSDKFKIYFYSDMIIYIKLKK